jgi:hypothetical protein
MGHTELRKQQADLIDIAGTEEAIQRQHGHMPYPAPINASTPIDRHCRGGVRHAMSERLMGR